MSEHSFQSFFAKIGKALIPLVLLLAGGAAWAYFHATAPTIEKAAPQREPTVVQVQTVHTGDARMRISVMGTVVPSREVTLKARVAGEIRSVASQFIPGGYLAKGAELVSLDRSDHQVAVQKAQSALANARAALAIEQGSQTIAREELRLLSELSAEAVDQTDLALRKPQLAQAQAAVASAEADLRQALLNLERTVVRVPFNALIIQRDVNLGTFVAAQNSLATIVATDEFWIEAVVPLDQMPLIDFDPEGGCPAEVRSQTGPGQWSARVIRVAGKLNETSRMATLIVAVADPLGIASGRTGHPLMIDDYVFVEIAGRELSGVIELPRASLKDGNTVWVCDHDTLDIRDVTLAWKNGERVYIRDGLAAGEQVVLSEIATPVRSMPLKIAETRAGDAMSAAAGKRAAK